MMLRQRHQTQQIWNVTQLMSRSRFPSLENLHSMCCSKLTNFWSSHNIAFYPHSSSCLQHVFFNKSKPGTLFCFVHPSPITRQNQAYGSVLPFWSPCKPDLYNINVIQCQLQICGKIIRTRVILIVFRCSHIVQQGGLHFKHFQPWHYFHSELPSKFGNSLCIYWFFCTTE